MFFNNKDENVHRYAVREGKDRERERDRVIKGICEKLTI